MKTNQQKGLLLRKLLLLMVATIVFQILKAQDTVSVKPVIPLSQAQDSLHLKQVTYKVAIKPSKDKWLKGYLSSLSDTSVYVSSRQVKFNRYTNTNAHLGSISYNNISTITIRRKGGTGRGMLIGVITGVVTGVIVGLASGDDKRDRNGWCLMCYTAGEKAGAFGAVSGLIGTLVGGIIGSADKTFIIKNNKEKFDDFKWKLMH
jgi:hypothetical protein